MDNALSKVDSEILHRIKEGFYDSALSKLDNALS